MAGEGQGVPPQMLPEGAPHPDDAYRVIEEGAGVYRMTFLIDVEATAPAVAKFRTQALFDAIFGMMNDDQGVRLKAAIAGGDAARWIRGVAALGDTEAVTHPFDLAEFERQRNMILALAEGASMGADAPSLLDRGVARRMSSAPVDGRTEAPQGQEGDGFDAGTDDEG